MSTSLDPSSPVRPVGSESSRASAQRPDVFTHESSSTPAPVFREGEVVRGRVLEVLAPQSVRVELPSGTFTATVAAGQLRRGDVLLFQVQAVDPQLVLQVHSVMTGGQNTRLSEADIVRLLGQSANPVTLEIARVTGRSRSTISVRDFEDIIKGLTVLTGQASLPEQIDILIKMRDAGIPLEQKFYTMMESLFVGGKQLPRHMQTLQTAAATPSAMQELLSSIVTTVEKPFASVRDVFRRWTLAGGAELYNLLRGVADTTPDAFPAGTAVRESAMAVMGTMEAQQFYNVFALQHNAVLVFHMMFPVRGQLMAAKLELESVSSRDGREAPQSFRVSTDMSALGEVVASGFAMRKLLSVTLLAETADDAAFIDQYHDELATALRHSGFVLQSLQITDRQRGDGDGPATAMQHVNLVV